MKKILVSGYEGSEYRQISSLTFPLMEKYANKYNIDSVLLELPNYGRAASWSKIPTVMQLLVSHDLVLWLDSDVVVENDSEDVTVLAKDDSINYLCYHNVGGNKHPNCGVWMVKREMLPFLGKLWEMTEYLNHFWWEQAALIELIGMQMDSNNRVSLKNPENDLYKRTTFIDNKWNYCWADDDKSQTPFFNHFAGAPNRLHQIQNLVYNL